MATANSTRRSAGSSLSTETDEFAALSRRLLVSINHVVLVSQHFGDLADLPPEHAPAGMTLHVAAQDLDGLYNELDSWHVRHEHAPKSADVSGLGVFTGDDSARTPLAGLPPALSCPFCGRHDDIMVSETSDTGDHGKWYRASCGTCGADAPGGETTVQAAHGWNKRSHSVPPAAAATSEPIVEADSAAALPPIGASDKTADRIRAFLMSVRPLRGGADADGGDKYQRGRVLIERMAVSAKADEDPSIVLSPQHCADVLNFLHHVEPFEPQTWWEDPADAPSHLVGFGFVLRTLENSLRREEQ